MIDKLNFEIDVRIPSVLIQQMMDGEITCAMLVTMNILYKWANWSTGRVRWVSSGGLRTASRKAYSDRTFRVSLQRLEEMGWITRHMVPGNHKDYAVTIHNYKVTDDAGKVRILNPKELKVSDPFKINPYRETSHQGSQEGSQDTSHEGSQKDLHNIKHGTEHNPEHNPEHNTEGQSVSPSVSLGTDVPAPENQNREENPSETSRSITEEQNQPRNQKPEQDFITFERMPTDRSELGDEEKALMDAVGTSSDLAALLGIPYLFGCEANLCAIACVLKARNRSERWLVALLRWVRKAEGREAKFWSSRIHTGTRGLTQLAKHLATGELPQQFDAQLSAIDPDALEGAMYVNPLLHRDYKAEQYEPRPNGYKPKAKAKAAELPDDGYTLDELRPAPVRFDVNDI